MKSGSIPHQQGYSTSLRLSWLGGLVFGFACLGANLSAQTYEQVAPKTPSATAPSGLPQPAGSANADRNTPDRIVVPSLRGLVFVTDVRALRPEGAPVSGVQVHGEPLLETGEFRSLAGSYLGHPLTVAELDRLTREVVIYFRKHGRPVVDVFAPEQKVAEGTVQILVLEGRLGEVRVEGNRWFGAEQIRSAIRGRSGEVIEGTPLLQDIAWLNENAFREVDLVFMRGSDPGQTDIVLRTRDRFPVRGYAGYEDSGNSLTGYDRVLAGVNLGNPFGNGQQLNYQFTASPDGAGLRAHAASYVVPIERWRHTLTLFGSYAESRPDLPDPVFALAGRSAQLGARYQVPLALPATWTGGVTAGADFKRTNNNLSFGGTQVFAQQADVIQVVASLALSHVDKRGSTSGQFMVAVSPGGLDANNHSRQFTAVRGFARPDYAYVRLTLDRRKSLPHGWSWVAWGTAQFSSANLLGSEQLGLGGADALRGYEEREANGDDGYVIVNELHAPVVHLASVRQSGLAADGLDPLVFVDYGRVWSQRRLPGDPSALELASAGVGLRYRLGATIAARLDYGWQLKSSGVASSGRTNRAHVSVTIGF